MDKGLICREALLDKLSNCTSSWGVGMDRELRAWWSMAVKIKDNILREIKDAPEIDARPVVHGYWRLLDLTGKDSNVPYVKYSHVECSVCRDIESSVLYNRRFCPNCGAKMDLEG